MIPTKLNVFEMAFDVNTPQFIKEACENSGNGMYRACWFAFRELLAMVAERATELNDPIMNVLMLRLALYEVPLDERRIIIEQIRLDLKKGGANASS